MKARTISAIKIVALTCAAVILLAGGMYAVIISFGIKKANETIEANLAKANSMPAVIDESKSDVHESEKKTEAKSQAAKPETAITESIKEPTPTEKKVEPKVLSIQEYGKKYLDLSTPQFQQCFDDVIDLWPERFTEGVRERNIKALSIYASPCGTGITHVKMIAGTDFHKRLYEAHIVKMFRTVGGKPGVSGEFFDSELAKAQW